METSIKAPATSFPSRIMKILDAPMRNTQNFNRVKPTGAITSRLITPYNT